MAGSGFLYDTRRKMQALAARVMPKAVMCKIYTRLLCGYFPNLKAPKSFNEKVTWLKINYFHKNDLAVKMADKLSVREVLKDRGLDFLLPNLYMSCDNAMDIEWDKLPNKFVIKCNHGCAYNIVCNDKEKLDKQQTIKKLSTWMKQDFGLYNIEPHYSKINRKIFVEEHLGNELIDYKFFCFHGKPEFLYISKDLINDSTAEMVYYTIDWERIPLKRDDYKLLEDVEKPACYAELLKYASDLSKDFPFVRVDFYVINGKPMFSEMTFTPCAGMMPISPSEYDKKWGELIDLTQCEK